MWLDDGQYDNVTCASLTTARDDDVSYVLVMTTLLEIGRCICNSDPIYSVIAWPMQGTAIVHYIRTAEA